MPGRHSATPSAGARRRVPDHGAARPGRGALAIVAGAVLLFSVAGWSAVRSFGGGSACDDGQGLTLAASPEIAPVVEAVLSPADGDEVQTEDGCRITVQWTDPDAALAAIDAGERAPDLWIPDTSAWLSRLPPDLRERPSRSVATTPVVLAGPPGAAQPETWLSALSEPGATMLDPGASGASVGALAALHGESVHGLTSGTELSQWLVRTAQAAPEYSFSDEDLLNNASNGGDVAGGWFPTTEQKFVDAAQESAGVGLATAVPRSGTVLLDYPLVPVATGDEASAATEAARLVAERLASPSGIRQLAQEGFRPASGAPIHAEGSLGTVTEIGVLQPDAVARLLNTWVTLTADARMLTVLDVSGSMEELAGARTRVELARDAALAALGDLPGEWQLGLWVFSLGLGEGPVDHTQLAPVRTLRTVSGGRTHREALSDVVRQLPAMTAGGTALYDTALAAYRNAMAGYDPNRFNSVVLLTDGYNDDEDGISLRQLLDTLRREQDPARPVQLITIGMGPGADTEALRQIAEATGAPSYVVRDPRDIEQAFNDALLKRAGRE
jgi:Mg-chelatase subunit ChlD